MSSEERRPLLAPTREVIIDELDSDELPQPILSNGNIPCVKCKICNSLINLDGKLDCYVVKCHDCHEATPIKAPPIGKKYVRCQCHCLLICKAGSKRVACPRDNCKLIIILEAPSENRDGANELPLRVLCGHCNMSFLFSPSARQLARCPHCKKVSSIQPKHEKMWSMVFFSLGILFLLAGSILTGLTAPYVNEHKGLYAGYVVLFLLSVIMFARAIHYSCIKVSHIENTPTAYSI